MGHHERRVEALEIQLYYLVAEAFADVLDLGANLHRVLKLRALLAYLDVGVCEARVREAVAEGIQRLTLQIAVGPALHPVVGELGHILQAARERDGQTPGGGIVAEQHIRERAPARLPWIPGL